MDRRGHNSNIYMFSCNNISAIRPYKEDALRSYTAILSVSTQHAHRKTDDLDTLP